MTIRETEEEEEVEAAGREEEAEEAAAAAAGAGEDIMQEGKEQTRESNVPTCEEKSIRWV